MRSTDRYDRSALVAVLILAVIVVAGSLFGHSAPAQASTCGHDAVALDGLFGGEAGRVVGADYLRAYQLPNGTTLVLMQDVFLGPASGKPVRSLGSADFVHNAGVLLDRDGCVARTITGEGSYLGGDLTRPLARWFWAMGGALGPDGVLHVLVAEMVNPARTGAAIGATPVATWRATIDPPSLEVTSFQPAADGGASLFGWAVASDAEHTYLYSHCNRQFVPGEVFGHDTSCTADVRVARVPRGHLEVIPEYFDGTGWSPDSAAAAILDFPGARAVNPVSVQQFGAGFIAVSKEGDWWGTTIYVDTAPSATGPWTTVATLTPEPKCADCNTYFASLMPWRQRDGALVVGLSNNAWDMQGVAYEQPALYRSSFHAIPLPVAPKMRRAEERISA